MLLRESSENTGEKMIKIKFFKTLKFNQNLASMRGTYLFKKNDWITVRTMSFVAFYLPLLPSPSPQFCGNLENRWLCTYCKNLQLRRQWRGKNGFEAIQKAIPRKLSSFNVSGRSLERIHSQSLSLLDPTQNFLLLLFLTQNFLYANSPIPRALVKNNVWWLLNITAMSGKDARWK